MLTLQHNMAGLNGKPKVLEEECSEWLNSFEQDPA